MSGQKLIGMCGLICSECGAFLATKNNEDALREKTADEWSQMFGVDIKPETVNCVGCITQTGTHFQHCSVCEIRACVQQKQVANCGHCPDYACDKITRFFKVAPDAKAVLDAEHNASMR